MIIQILPLCLLLSFGIGHQSSSSIWSWQCVEHEETGPKCVREADSSNLSSMTLTTCRLICGKGGGLFPLPRQVSLGKEVVYFVPSQITHSLTSCHGNVCVMLNEAVAIMLRTLNKYHPKLGELSESQLWEGQRRAPLKEHNVVVNIDVSGLDEYLMMGTDESYALKISTNDAESSVVIKAPTFFGARHALETLNQLMDYDKARNSLQMVESANIEDSPTFPYRGLIVDTSRNFLSVKTLKRILDGMSYNKLNSFHWHSSDSQSFPLHFDSLPLMSQYGTYYPEMVYTSKDVKELVQYARVRGIRIVPELDAPAHVGYGWQWGQKDGLGNLVVCLNKQPWTTYCAGPPCGQMNLANENLYHILGKVYTEMVEMFQPIEMFHYGGDEVNLACWNSSTEIINWMTENNFGLSEDAYFKQWSAFQEKAWHLFTNANNGKEALGILWTSTLTDPERLQRYVDKSKYAIQIWSSGNDPTVKNLLEKGYKVIFSNYDALYLDCGVSSWVSKGGNWCSPYKGWQDIYDNDIRFLAFNVTGTDNYDSQILGAEAASWSEQIDEATIDAKLWPRGAALAERLWTNPKENFTSAEARMVHHRQRLVTRGLGAARLQPEWCHQNEGECTLPWAPKVVEEQVETQESEEVAQAPAECLPATRLNSGKSSDFGRGITEFPLIFLVFINIIYLC